MKLCVYVCMYVRMYVCMYVLRMYACMYECMYVCTYVCMYVCAYGWMDGCVYVCMYVCMSVCMYVIMLEGGNCFIYGLTNIRLTTTKRAREETRCRNFIGWSFQVQDFYMPHFTDKMVHTSAFVRLIMKHWPER